MSDSCRNCTHTRDAHEHFRAGSDCSGCECMSFKRQPVMAMFRRSTRKPTVVLFPETLKVQPVYELGRTA